MGWTPDGKSLYVSKRGIYPARIFRLEIAYGKAGALEGADASGSGRHLQRRAARDRGGRQDVRLLVQPHPLGPLPRRGPEVDVVATPGSPATSCSSATSSRSSGTTAREDYFPLEKLRRNCPCAGCRGEKDLLGQPLQGPRPAADGARVPGGRAPPRRRVRRPDRLGRRPQRRDLQLRGTRRASSRHGQRTVELPISARLEPESPLRARRRNARTFIRLPQVAHGAPLPPVVAGRVIEVEHAVRIAAPADQPRVSRAQQVRRGLRHACRGARSRCVGLAAKRVRNAPRVPLQPEGSVVLGQDEVDRGGSLGGDPALPDDAFRSCAAASRETRAPSRRRGHPRPHRPTA